MSTSPFVGLRSLMHLLEVLGNVKVMEREDLISVIADYVLKECITLTHPLPCNL